MQPYDDAEEGKLRELRDRLSDVLRVRAIHHDQYRFHISFGYPIAWLDYREEDDFRECWRHWSEQIAAKAPEILLAAPEYCTFRDMFAFHRHFYVGKKATVVSVCDT